MQTTKPPWRIVVFRLVAAVFGLWAFGYPFVFGPTGYAPEQVIPPTIGKVPDFSAHTNVVEKKRAFFAYLLPEIKRQNTLVMQERMFLLGLQQQVAKDKSLNKASRAQLSALLTKYKVDETLSVDKQLALLIKRADIIPPELVLAQAANESAWGTSRFAQQGYNFFGLWCFKKGCGFVPSRRTEGSNHEVAKFRDLSHAVNTYIRNLNRHFAYQELRDIRKGLRESQQEITAEALAQGLLRYSERGQDYIDELLNMITYNRKYMNV